jgi:hypothetical protein
MHVTILGRRWNLRFCRLKDDYGQCDHPDKPSKEIRINDSADGCVLLESLLHEMLHAANWHLDESFVTDCAMDMGRILWRLGYRKCE